MNNYWFSAAAGGLRTKSYADFVDRVNYFYSVLLLLFLSSLSATTQFFGSPIQCWLPADFRVRPGWQEYVETYCYVQGTYFVPIHDSLPDIKKVEISYYQWVPLFLALQAFLFYLPGFLWTSALAVYGIDLRLCRQKLAAAHEHVHSRCRHMEVRSLAAYILQFAQEPSPRPYFLTTAFLGVKCCAILNLLLQSFLVHRFLGGGRSHFLWNSDLSFAALAKLNWRDTGLFPRVAYCDFTVRDQSERTYSVQCALLCNLLNEKIYLFLWLWFNAMIAATGLNLLYWVGKCFYPRSADRFVQRHLAMCKAEFTPFLKSYHDVIVKEMGADGILLLRFLSQASSSEAITAELIFYLFHLIAK